MLRVQAERGGSVVALMEVPQHQIHLYGCAAATPTGEVDVVQVTALVEKPPADEAPSNLAVIGRYVLNPAVFNVLRDTPPGRGGEIQLTDALETLATMSPDLGGGVSGVVFRGRRYDTGDRADYLKAVVRIASDRDDLGPEFVQWLGEFVAERKRAGDGSSPTGDQVTS
jgi:UTP--glucose-1-phosphate uridylyltransferase